MSLRRNFWWQGLGQLGSRSLGLVFYLLLPRLVTLEVYGQFSFALSLALMVLQPTLELGLDWVITKWVSRGDPAVVQQAVIIRGGIAILCLLLLPLLTLFGPSLAVLTMLYSYLVLISAQRIGFAIQRGKEEMQLEGIANVAQKGLAIASLVLLASTPLPPLWLAPLALLISTALVTVGVWAVMAAKVFPLLWQPVNLSGLQATAKEGLMLGGVSLLGMIYFRVDSVMLGLLASNTEVGRYNLAYRLIEGAILIPSVVMAATFPSLAKGYQFRQLFRKIFLGLGGMGLLFTGVVVALAPLLLTLAYGEELQSQTQILRWLALTLLPIYWGHLATQGLVALDRQRHYFRLTIGAVFLNVGLNWWLIPLQGAEGAAIATLITEVLMTISCFAAIWWIMSRKPV